jgi:tetratricopeptide (TPR) repeat protein
MRGLWEEIQEATLNSADYYLSRALEDPARGSELTRDAARLYARYLAHFERYATIDSTDYVPDSAYFAAYEAARGYGDAFVAYGIANPRPAEIHQAVERYRLAIRAFPFDRNLWPSLTTALERRGRANDFLAIARPTAEVAANSRYITSWVAQDGAGVKTIEVYRRALGDELVLMYMGFADANGLAELEESFASLKARRAALARELEALAIRRDTKGPDAPPASPAGSAGEGGVRYGTAESRQIARELEDGGRQLAKIDKQISARARALPLFKAVVASEDLAPALRSQRQNPIHTLLRRLYHEG